MRFRVVVLEPARRDADAIVDWIAERSSAGALKWRDAIAAALSRVADAPDGCGLAEEADEIIGYTSRQFVFKTRRGRSYRGDFVIVDDEVRVLRIRGPGHPLLSQDELD